MANISHFTQTVNGVSTTYDIHDANAVDLTSNQTVAGIKTFSDSINNKDIQQFIFNKEYSDTVNSWLGIHNYFDKSDNRIGFHAIGDFDGNRGFRWFIKGESNNSVETDIFGFGRTINETSYLYINATLETDLIPTYNNSKSLGSSTNKWKDVNTILLNGKTPAYNDDVIPRSGGAVLGQVFSRATSDSEIRIDGGNGYGQGAMLSLSGKYRPGPNAGAMFLYVGNDSTDHLMFLYPSGTWTWNGTACQITSDQRYKQQIAEIDDKLLDAWKDVAPVQFKYNDAVNEKGDKARLHTGYVVQQIDKACQSHGVDVSAYGLYCHEEYPQETEEVEVEQADGTKTKETKVIREASEHYSLRYTEVYAVECMYLRRCIARLTARIEELEKGNNTK